ncbi:translocation/assembly module TamB domain-containing protein, partial [Hydrogenophaga sp.]|uniref:translocation/assembly module TamB domain-containing protein n=1 Tax=Hydrogenophaga sp. TaxID=1904254 RepID=UPI00356A0DF4
LSLPGARGQLDGDIGYAQGRGDLSLNIDNAAQVLAWARRLQTLPVVGPAIARQLQTQPALQNLQASGQASLGLQWQGGLAEIGFPAPAAAAANKAPAALRLQVALDVPRLEASGLTPTPVSATPTTPAAATGTATAAPGSSPPTAWSVRGLRLKVDGSLADLAIALQGQGSFATWRGEIQTQARLTNALPATAAQRQAESRLDIGSLQIQAQDGSRPDRVVDWSVRSEAPLWLGWLNTATGWALQAGPGQLQVLPTFSATGTRTAASKTAARQPLSLAWDSVRWQAQSLQTRGRLRGLPLSWIDALAATGANAAGPMAQAGVAGDIVFDGEWDLFLPAQTGGAEPLRLNAQLQRSSGDLSVRTGAGQGDAGSAAGSTGQLLQAGVREARLNLSAQGRQIKASLRWDSERLGQASADVGTELAAPGKPAPNVSALDHWWPASAPLNGSFKAALPQVGVWSALAPPGWRMRGTLQAEASISGTRGAPKWRGSLQAEQLALRSVLDGFEFANGQLRATLEDERITIERLVLEGPGGSAAGGTLQAQGQAQWRAPSPGAPREPLIDLTVDTRQLRVSSRPDRRLTLSGQVKAQLAGPRLQIRGQLSADSALFILPDELAPTLGDDVVVRGGRSLPQGTATGVPIEPDVQVQLDLGQQFEVRGRGLKTRLSGQLTVRSTPTAPTPRVLGEVRTVSGTYRAYGQQLTIETGVLRFTGPYDNPTLDIAAVRPQIGDASQRVGVQISGSAQAPRVRLFSDPELPDSEKLAWLVLGRPATGAGAEAAVLQQAALALLARNGGQLDGGFAQAFGLDELGVRGEGTNADGSTTAAALTLGKQLSSKLYLSYERSLAGTVGTVSMFYDVSRRLTVRARAGEENAIDLIFTLRYD